jgi:hypothetical protein
MRPFGRCPLCLNDRELCASHLLPAAAYKPLRASHQNNPHPLILTDTVAYQTSRQATAYLLCRCCEERFHQNGEDWILSHSYRSPAAFRFRDALIRGTPYFKGPEGTLYAAADIAELDMERVIYFAMSVFWRAAVHRWRRDDRVIKIDLGPYQDPIRKYLYEKTPFPEKMTLRVWVSALEGNLCAVCHLPEAGRKDGVHTYQFAIPGMSFELMVGGRIHEHHYLYSSAPAPERFVAIIPALDIKDMAAMAKRLSKRPQK